VKVIESFVQGKDPLHPDLCEDRIVLTDAFIGLFDGTSDLTGVSYSGWKGGRFAAEVVGEALNSLPESISPDEAIVSLSEMLREAVQNAAKSALSADGPSTSLLVYSRSRNEVWRVGDSNFRIGNKKYQQTKRIDRVTSMARAAYLQAEELVEPHDSSSRDAEAGRELIMPLLKSQFRFRNFDKSIFGYGAIDGSPVPKKFIEVVEVPRDTEEIVFASDGYPYLRRTLAESERALRSLITLDPLMIRKHPSTKSVLPGNVSYDDRSFVRFSP
jgi:hypothetical protein